MPFSQTPWGQHNGAPLVPQRTALIDSKTIELGGPLLTGGTLLTLQSYTDCVHWPETV